VGFSLELALHETEPDNVAPVSIDDDTVRVRFATVTVAEEDALAPSG